jgi:hypothetical protein
VKKKGQAAFGLERNGVALLHILYFDKLVKYYKLKNLLHSFGKNKISFSHLTKFEKGVY